MQASLVASQFATLEEPREALRLDAELAVPQIVAGVRRAFGV
jgi:gluconate kinase